MPGLEVKTTSNGGGCSHEGGYGAYEGYSEEWNDYSGCTVRYLADGDGVHGDIGWYSSRVDIDFDVSPGDVVFVVVAVYTTGGTFGQTRGNTEVVRVYNDGDKAFRLKTAIQENNSKIHQNKYSDDSEYWKFDFEGDEIYAGTWKGYFESLDGVHVETEVVRA